ncbi:Cys-Gln thioester bond-forming surface protein [Leucobacter sp.]
MTPPSPPPSVSGRRPARLILAAAVIGLLALSSSWASGTPAEAAVSDRYKYFGSSASGTSIRTTASASNFATRLYNLTGQAGATSTSGYSVDFTGTPPQNNNDYTEAPWGDLPRSSTIANEGRVEWILKNSYPRVTTTALRDTLRATAGYESFPSGYFPESDAIAATQAAIWHLTDDVSLDPNNTSPNTARVKLLYRYLLEFSEGREPASAQSPRLEIRSETGRTEFTVEPQGAFGPFVLDANTDATPSVSGPARLVDAAGQTLTGAQSAGTSFWVQPTASPAAAGSATVSAQTASITTTSVHALFGKQQVSPFAARETLSTLSSSSQRADDTLQVSWEIDQNSPEHYDPDGEATERGYVYHPRAELSPTLERVAFTDGTTTRTDLVGLTSTGTHQSTGVYSADFAATAVDASQGPSLPSGSRYREEDWSANGHLAQNPHQGAVARVLRSSYPELTVAQLTTDLKAANRLPQSSGNVKNWEAIAGTQAAVWHFTDGKRLDTTRYASPRSAASEHTADGFDPGAVLDGDPSTGWRAAAPGEAILEFVFPADFEPRSYTVTTLAGGEQSDTPTAWRLQRSLDGVSFSDVSTGSVSHTFDGGEPESRTSGNIPPGASYGAYSTIYRIVFSGAADPEQPVQIGDVAFTGFGVFGAQPNYEYREYANATNVVQTYLHLVELGDTQPVPTPEPVATLAGALEHYERNDLASAIGPFRYEGSQAAEITLSGLEDSTGAGLLREQPDPSPEEESSPGASPAPLHAAAPADEDGEPVNSLVLAPGETFYLQPGDGESGEAVLTASSTSTNWITARALTGTTSAGSPGPTLAQLGVQSTRASFTLNVPFSLAQEPAAPIENDDDEPIDDSDPVEGNGPEPDEEIRDLETVSDRSLDAGSAATKTSTTGLLSDTGASADVGPRLAMATAALLALAIAAFATAGLAFARRASLARTTERSRP